MGFGGISIWQLLIILVIVVLLFGTGKLRSLGSDLGGAIRNFRAGVKSADDQPGADRPGADQPGADRPGADQPGADEPKDRSGDGTPR